MASILSPSSPLLYILLAPVVLFAIWQFNATIAPPPPPPAQLQQGKRIVLLIAHPDDESMFFSPTITRLTDPALGNHVKILCLSTGNADGLGETRKKELETAATTLGLRKSEDVFVIDDPSRFKDGMKEEWDEKQIAKVLAQAFIGPDKGKKAGTNDGPRATIDALITFDTHGISSHPNHIAVFHGARLFLSNLMHDHAGFACPVALYTLTSINILRKYSLFLDILPTYFVGIMSDMISGLTGKKSGAKNRGISKGSKGSRVVFLSDMTRYLKARDAMVHGHKSQMVWFRWGWITIGRYMFVNDLKREDI